ncbi:MAG TPA: hypothetical protein PK228_20980 [Saprospiraceae bacterium]|nr:hypothetical protein [Saprospiraceae bacterium]
MNNKFWSFNRSRDASLITTESIFWQGPFSWTGFEQTNKLKPIPNVAGVYLFAFEYKDGYILCSAGISISIKKRVYQHTREFEKGNYTILDIDYAKFGERKEVWHDWQYAKTHQDEFIENKEFILNAVQKQLGAYRLFITEIEDKRKRERIEFAIMQSIYSSKEPWADLADGGMNLRGRYNSEIPIEIKNICSCRMYGLPEVLEV